MLDNPQPTRIAGRYDIDTQLGAGGMGAVYRATDRTTGATVAIKQLHPSLARPELIERFRREGQALRDLRHPNIVALLDAVEENGQHYLVIEYVAGGDLRQQMRTGPPPPVPQVLSLALDLADALTRAHRLNIIHRDLKPDNVLIANDGTPRLADFGIASRVDSNTSEEVLRGTLSYLSPELLLGLPPSPRSDIWAFGVMLVELLTGRHPFANSDASAVLHAILNQPLPDLELDCPDAPPALLDLLYRMLSKNPEERIPSVRLVGAELEVLLHSGHPPSETDRLLGFRSDAFAATPAATQRIPHNLPHQSSHFVGRDHELDLISKLLTQPATPLLTIVGPGGMGKTRLSLEAATRHREHFPQGTFLVELAPLATADAIPLAVADAVGYPVQPDGRSTQQQLVEFFRERTMLLVLDNFEHLIAGRAFVQALLQGAPNLKVLATSRERLGLTAEQLLPLEGLDFPAWETPEDALNYSAVQLLLESARRIRPDFTLTAEDLPYAARITRRVQGTPLALVLAGNWLELLTVRELADELAASLDVLESTLQDLPERHRTMRAVFDYTWRLLGPDDQQVFARLSVFRGGLTRAAAQAVAGANLRTLQTLVNKSILRRDAATGRFEVHELLRQFAYEHMQHTGEAERIEQAHAAFFSAQVAEAAPKLKGTGQLATLAELDADYENIKTAWRHAVATHATDLLPPMIEGLFWYCTFRSRIADAEALFDMARQTWPMTAPDAGLLAAQLGARFPTANDRTAIFERGLALAQAAGDPQEIAFCTRQLGHWLSHSAMDHARGIPLLESSIAQYRALHDDFYTATVLDDLGWSLNVTGNWTNQRTVLEECLQLRRTIGDKIGQANALRNMGGAAGGMGATDLAPYHYWSQALELAYEIGDRPSIAWNHFMKAGYWLFLGEFDSGRADLTRARLVATDVGLDTIVGGCLMYEALEIALTREDYAEARALARRGYPPGSPADLRIQIFAVLNLLFGLAEGNIDLARRAIGPLRALGMRREEPFVAISLLAAMGVYADEGEYEKAAETLGLARNTANVHPLMKKVVNEWSWAAQFAADIEGHLGVEAFQAAVQRGYDLDPMAALQHMHDTDPADVGPWLLP